MTTIKGKRQTVTLALVDGSTLDLPGTAYGKVAIVRLETGDYRLIHIATGWQMGTDYPRKLAIQLAQALNTVDLDTLYALPRESVEAVAMRNAAHQIIQEVGRMYYDAMAARREAAQ